MAEYEKAVRKILAENGCWFIRHGKGGHDIWHSSINNHNVSVDQNILSLTSPNMAYKMYKL